jgi:alkylmercury lyase
LDRHPDTDWDDHGRIVGFGVSIRPTPHAFSFDGGTIYGWCATAALELPIILGRAGVGTSTCPATGAPIRVELTPDRVVRVDPAEAVVSTVRPTEAVTDIRAEICNLGSFFNSPEAAADWLTNHPQGHVDPITTEFAITQRVMNQLGWTAQ